MILRVALPKAELDRTQQLLRQRLSATLDLEPIATGVARILARAAQEQVDSQGQRGGTPYRPLSRSYAIYKQQVVGNKPILVFSGRLRAALQKLPRVQITNRRRVSFEFHQLPPYAGKHQTGQGRLPARPIVSLTEADRRKIVDAYLRYRRKILQKRGG